MKLISSVRLVIGLVLVSCVTTSRADGTTLGIHDAAFTLGGKPAFLLGISYYGALGATPETWKSDLDAMRRYGYNWIRVWATWDAFGNNVSAVDADGRPREPYLGRLKQLVAECDRRGMALDVTLTRGDGSNSLHTLEAHKRTVTLLARELKPWRNWYLDLSNERNIRDARYTPMEDLLRLRDVVKRVDPARLVTASQGGDISREELRDYLLTARVDFVCPHRPRDRGTAAQTEAVTQELLRWMKELGKTVPVHYQEPFRRGYAEWQPGAEDFAADMSAAKKGGAAGWCLHNGSTRRAKDERPRRSFDLRDGKLFDQLDAEERRACELLKAATGVRGNPAATP